MLKPSSLTAAYPLAEALAGSGLIVTPAPGTPLEALVNACVTLDQMGIRYEGAGVEVAEQSILEASTAKDLGGVVRHDVAMDEFVKASSDTVLKNMNLAKNVVNPMVQAVVDQATAVADGSGKEDYLPMSVEPFYYASIFSNPLLVEMVSKYDGFPVVNQDLTLGLPKFTVEQIRAAAKTGNPRFDEDVEAFTKAMGDDEIMTTFQGAFGGGQMPYYTRLNEMLSTRPGNAGRVALLFLLSSHFLNDIPDGLNMELDLYRAYMSTIMAQSARAVAAAMRLRNDNVRMKYMVMEAPYKRDDQSLRGTFKVNGDVYNQYLKDGGTPEALFGAANSGMTGFDAKDLIENNGKYAESWRRTFELIRTASDYKRFNYFLDGLRQAMLTQIEELDESLRMADNGLYRQRLVTELTNIKGGGIKEPWKIARKLVCRVFFPHTDAERILSAIDAQSKAHPELDVREAATLALIETVSKWVATQFKVTNAVGMVRG
jgi:hypothetical protein